VGYCIVCCLTVICFMSFALYVLITRFMFFNILSTVVFLFCVFVFLFSVPCVFVSFYAFFLLMYLIVSFLFVHKFTGHWHWVEMQLQLINITSHHIT
jgi:hypothetical protein